MRARYDGLADEYDAFVDRSSPYRAAAEDALRRFLGPGPGRCLDLGCGGGHFLGLPVALGWEVVGVDVSTDQLRIARAGTRSSSSSVRTLLLCRSGPRPSPPP